MSKTVIPGLRIFPTKPSSAFSKPLVRSSKSITSDSAIHHAPNGRCNGMGIFGKKRRRRRTTAKYCARGGLEMNRPARARIPVESVLYDWIMRNVPWLSEIRFLEIDNLCGARFSRVASQNNPKRGGRLQA